MDTIKDVSYLGILTYRVGAAGESTNDITFYGDIVGMTLGRGEVPVRDPERFGPVPNNSTTAANKRTAKTWCQEFLKAYKESN